MSPQPGWYPNPEDPTTDRWWGGDAWATQTRPRGGGFGPPAGTSRAALGTKPDNGLVWAILATVFCCLPFGIVAIVHATRVDAAWDSGDPVGAHRAAAEAAKWSKWSALSMLAIMAFYVLVLIVIPLAVVA